MADTVKRNGPLLKVLGIVLGILAGLVTVGFMPKISDIATVQEVEAVDARVRVLEKAYGEQTGELRAIRMLLEQQADSKKVK